MNGKIDIVYTWVDDRQDGYLESLDKYATNALDRNPNRTRDNLDLLKYSLRSVERYLDCHGDIFLFTCRPQKPLWLKPGNRGIQVIHHDDVIDARFLPTFNSFCIVSHLAGIEGVSDPFLYMEDDMLFAAETGINDFITDNGLMILYPRLGKATPAGKQHDEKQPPWNKALAYSNHLLDAQYGEQPRYSINRVPLLIFKKTWNEMLETWHDAFEYTRQCRFRSLYNIAPEYLYPYICKYKNLARVSTFSETYKKSFYLGLDNSLLLARAGLYLLDKINPRFYCLNDNFGGAPEPRVEKYVRQFLEERYPDKSAFES